MLSESDRMRAQARSDRRCIAIWLVVMGISALAIGVCCWKVSSDCNWSWSYKDKVQETVRAEMKKCSIGENKLLEGVVGGFGETSHAVMVLHDRVLIQDAKIEFLENRIKILEGKHRPKAEVVKDEEKP